MNALGMNELWREVQANLRAMEACKRHRFTEELVRVGQKIVCQECGAEMRLTDIGQYIRGYIAAGGNASDVWPAWSRRGGRS